MDTVNNNHLLELAIITSIESMLSHKDWLSICPITEWHGHTAIFNTPLYTILSSLHCKKWDTMDATLRCSLPKLLKAHFKIDDNVKFVIGTNAKYFDPEDVISTSSHKNLTRGNCTMKKSEQPEHTHAHTHTDDHGRIVKCYHQCKDLLSSPIFWITQAIGWTISFPFEHALYEKVWPFTIVGKWLGL